MDATQSFVYPGDKGAKLMPKSRYENFIGGKWTKPKDGNYFENVSPTTGRVICEVARSNAADVDAAFSSNFTKFSLKSSPQPE